MFGADIFQRFCTNLNLREKVMNQFLYFVATITFSCMSAKHDVSFQSTFYTALKTLEKSTHFMLTHVLLHGRLLVEYATRRRTWVAELMSCFVCDAKILNQNKRLNCRIPLPEIHESSSVNI